MLARLLARALAGLLPVLGWVLYAALGVGAWIGLDGPPGRGLAGPGEGTPRLGAGVLATAGLATAAWLALAVAGALRERGRPAGDLRGWGVGLLAASLAALPAALLLACLLSAPYAHPGFWVLYQVGAVFPGLVVFAWGRMPAEARRARRWRTPLVWLALVLALLVAGEGAQQILLGPPPVGLPSRTAAGGSYWYFEPGAAAMRGGVRYRFNRFGFRGPEPAADRPASARVLLLGDSIPFGGGYPEEVVFPWAAGRKMEEEAHREAPEILNAAMPGFGLAQIARLFEDRLVDLAADRVLLVFYVDDLNRPPHIKVDGRLTSPEWPGWMQLLHGRSHVWRNLLGLAGVGDATYLGYRPRSFREALPSGLRQLDRILAEVRRRGGRLALLNIPYFDWRGVLGDPDRYAYRDLDREIRGWCARRGVRYRELLPDLAREDIDRLRVRPDDVHFNAAGHAWMARRLSAFLREWR